MNDLSPATVLLLLLATVNAALAHVLWGRHWLQLPVFWLAAFLGGLIVYGVGFRLPLPLELPMPAHVPVLESVLSAWVLIIIASRLQV